MSTPYAANVLAVYYRATPAERANGFEWYARANRLALRLSPDDVTKAAGVIAALSPMMPWGRNVLLAERTFAEGGLSGGALSANVAKANRIYNGEHPADVLTSDKVGNFWRNIAFPYDNRGVTIDRHAYDIAVGKRTDDDARKVLARKSVYAHFADIYREAAATACVSAPYLQAITWVVWRNMHNVKADGPILSDVMTLDLDKV